MNAAASIASDSAVITAPTQKIMPPGPGSLSVPSPRSHPDQVMPSATASQRAAARTSPVRMALVLLQAQLLDHRFRLPDLLHGVFFVGGGVEIGQLLLEL